MNNECLMCHAIIAPGHVYCDKCAITVTNHGAHTPQWPLANCQRCNNLIDSDWNLCPSCADETGVSRDGQWPVCKAQIPLKNQLLKQCLERADCHVVYGCLNFHINDMQMCIEHARVWWRAAKKGTIHCDACGEPVAEVVVQRGDGKQSSTQLPVEV